MNRQGEGGFPASFICMGSTYVLFPVIVFDHSGKWITHSGTCGFEEPFDWGGILITVIAFIILEFFFSRVLFSLKLRKHPY